MVFTAGLLGDDKDSGEGKYHCGSICLFYKGEAHLFNRNMTLLLINHICLEIFAKALQRCLFIHT